MGAREADDVQTDGGRAIATFAGGCFWCLEPVFSDLEGVLSAVPGYSGGHVKNPSYEDVCTGTTGHAEAVQVEFDPRRISYRDLLEVFFAAHDPTTPNRQGEDVGHQYRSAIFFHTPEQEAEARRIVAELGAAPDPHWEGRRIVTEIQPFRAFYPAEDYHRDYFRRNPDKGYCRLVIAPKYAKFRQRFAARLKDPAQSPSS
ncbi:MAG: peptide-methionine (S)-S-oxide reductase MsrA [Clostridia bacterium]|nr:peptide-methionine (S)-S-oxide reductase MsrA [Clostridia bacterium]